jgi:YfiH family protein
MEPRFERRWIQARIGLDDALVSHEDGAVMAFGSGPPLAAHGRASRLAAMIDDPVGPSAIRLCRQIHGRAVHPVGDASAGFVEVGDGDGLVTDRPGVGVLVWTADCVPILIAGDGTVAAIHAGWRGCAADIAGAAIERLTRSHHQNVERLRVALGPAICGNCYRVGREVVEALGLANRDATRWRIGNRVDLRGFLRAGFEDLGVPPDRIETVGGCTRESSELASYRRDGDAAGRQWSMVFLDR